MPHILIIDDAQDIRELVTMILHKAGHRVSAADNGRRGLAIALRDPPDLILMDLLLPELDGWEATRRLKAHPTTQNIPVLAFTAHLTEEDAADAIGAGCAAIIPKPFEIAVFLSQVDAFLDQQADSRRQRAAGMGFEG